VELIFEIIRTSLENRDKVKISGFGNFNIRTKKVRRGRNPQTGEEIAITARNVLTFKASPVLKKALNS
jgi:integration host factor subunit alpha